MRGKYHKTSKKVINKSFPLREKETHGECGGQRVDDIFVCKTL